MTETSGAVRGREAWLDYAKAIGIVLVVFGHVNRSIGGSGLEWPQALQATDRLIYSFHMPLFFILAGYASTLTRRRDLAGFLIGTFWGVLLPYVLGSAIWISAKATMSPYVNRPLEIGALWSIASTPVDHLWFLYDLLVARIGWFVVAAVRAPAFGWLALALLLVASSFTTSRTLSVAYYGIGVMLLGSFAGRSLNRVAFGVAAAAGILLWLVFVLWTWPSLGVAAKVLAAVAASAVVILLSLAAPRPISFPWKATGFVGEAALVIYLLHTPAAAGAREALKAVGCLNPATLLVAGIVCGLAIPLLAHIALLMAGGRMGCQLHRWMGLGSIARSSYFELSELKPSSHRAIEQQGK